MTTYDLSKDEATTIADRLRDNPAVRDVQIVIGGRPLQSRSRAVKFEFELDGYVVEAEIHTDVEADFDVHDELGIRSDAMAH